MCGIGGAWHFKGDQSDQALIRIGHDINSALGHRGPDSTGLFHDSELGIVIAHRRLAVIDTSSSGSQPMKSSCGRYILSYNGELYNHEEIRIQLKKMGRVFRGTSDSEVFLEAISEFGIEEMLKKTNGMFAFCLFDLVEKCLFLGRDRVGIKPLYYGVIDDVLYFGSELKAIVVHPELSPEIDSNALGSYVRFSYIPTPETIYRGISKLEPGSFLRITQDKSVRSKVYWRLDEAMNSCQSHQIFSPDEALYQVEELLKDSIRRQLISDVPVGLFLSGGIDSSLVAALGQEVSNESLKTFSVGFEDRDYDEAGHAKEIALNLGTCHNEMYLSEQEAISILPDMASVFDEPFGDSSQIPTYLISRETSKSVKVALSGDGADELFGGYKRYVTAEKVLLFMESIPKPFRGVIRGISERLTKVSRTPHIFGLGMHGPQGVWERSLKIGNLDDYDFRSVYEVIVGHWPEPRRLVRDIQFCPSFPIRSVPSRFASEALSTMQYIDLHSYLTDDILVKVDRTSMANSLEVRVPFLDHRIVELFGRLPRGSKIQKHSSKVVLRDILARRLPSELFDRPKVGFGIPLDSWLRGGLSEWAGDMLSPSMLAKNPFFFHEPILQKWKEHKSGKANWGYWLWDILMFQSWAEEQRR